MKTFKEINEKVKNDYNNHVLDILSDIDLSSYSQIPELKQVIESPGKMVRSTFTYITSFLANESPHPNLTHLLVIIEFIQAASLIHDDIIDNGLYRRGRKTIINEYGLNSALLLGDYLIFIVMRLIAEIRAEERKNEILKSVSSCLLLMYEGQRYESILIGNYEISEEDYFNVISNKSSVFFSMACELGIIIAGAKEHYRKSVVSYGYNLGIAYQMMDDLKSVIYLRRDKLDKSYQTDFERRLVTLPVIIAYKLSNKEEKEIIRNFYIGRISNKDSVIEVISCDMVIAEVKERITYFILKAKDELKDIEESRYKTALHEYCDYFLKEIE